MSKIKVSNFTKKYGKNTAVNKINFEVKQGEIVGFVGKNGAGKSTTIRALMNFISPTEGVCEIDGFDSIKNGKEIRRIASYMPSDAMFHQNTTGKDIFKLCLKFSDYGWQTAEELSTYFELDMTKKISELSLGNRKKVSIIQAMLKNSNVLILDEPTNGLDPLMQEKFFELIKKKNEAGATVFLSSHNLAEVEKYCDRAIIIKDGIIIEDINLKDSKLEKVYVVTYTNVNDEETKFEHRGSVNKLIKELSKIDIKHIEIRTKSVEEEFIKYYREDM